jgi:hypothetical protein
LFTTAASSSFVDHERNERHESFSDAIAYHSHLIQRLNFTSLPKTPTSKGSLVTVQQAGP